MGGKRTLARARTEPRTGTGLRSPSVVTIAASVREASSSSSCLGRSSNFESPADQPYYSLGRPEQDHSQSRRLTQGPRQRTSCPGKQRKPQLRGSPRRWRLRVSRNRSRAKFSSHLRFSYPSSYPPNISGTWWTSRALNAQGTADFPDKQCVC